MRSGWEEINLGEICTFENGDRGKNYPSKSVQTTSGVPFINAGHLTDNGIDLEKMNYIPEERFNLLGNGKIKENDILFCLRGSLGKFSIVAPLTKGAIASSLVIVRPNEKLLIGFLLLYFQSNLAAKMVDKYKNGAAQPNLSARSLKNFIIPLPPLAEQKRIVEILDEAFAAIATARANAQQNLANARELFESYLQGVFANPGEDWEEKALGDVTHKITDGKHGDCENEENSGYYFLSAKDVKENTLQYTNARQITKKDFEETHRRTNLEPSDVLVTNSGTIGRMAIAPNDDKTYRTTFQKSVAIIKPISSILDSVYCCYHLRADLKKLVNVSAGAAQKNLLLRDLRGHLIQIPSFPEQQSITKKLDAISIETKKLKVIYTQKITALDELKQSLLQKAFEGELTKEFI